MKTEKAREIIGEELLAVWPNMTENQQQAIRAGLTEREIKALEIALGLQAGAEQVSQTVEPVSAPAAPDAVDSWIAKHGRPVVHMAAGPRMLLAAEPPRNELAQQSFASVLFQEVPAHDYPEAMRQCRAEFDVDTFESQYRRSYRETQAEEPNKLLNCLTILLAIAAVIAVAMLAWFVTGRA